MQKFITQIKTRGWMERTLRESERTTKNRWLRQILRSLRLTVRIIEDAFEGDITLHAMSLVYTSLLAIVPMLALSFSVLKAFGVRDQEQMEEMLLQFLQPALGEKGAEITEKIIGFVENVKVGVLSSIGLVLLLYTAISMIHKIESAFNHIWQLKRRRSLMRRFSDYISLLLIGPVLVFTAFGVTGTLMNNSIMQGILSVPVMGMLYHSAAKMIPYLLVIAAFTFFYMFIPNTRVRFTAAVGGGVIMGIIWQTASWMFASFVVNSVQYTAIYSGFAILLVFMLWLYLNWLILLLGANLVFYLQFPDSLDVPRKEVRVSIVQKERLALAVLLIVGGLYYDKKHGASYEQLLDKVKIPSKILVSVIELLKEGGLLAETEQEKACLYHPARPLDETTLQEALDIIRNTAAADRQVEHSAMEKLDAVLAQSYRSQRKLLSSTTLKDLIVTRHA
jgi:membrane protein